MGLLWLYVFPMLFLPNLGVSRATAFGTLEISDFLIFPYLFLLCRNLPKQKGLLVYRLIPLLIAFAAWTSIGTLSIPIRYPGESSHYVFLGLLKFARLGLYVTAGILTVRKLSKAGMFPRFLWALTGAGVVIAVALILTPGEEESFGAVGAMQGFKTHNAVSVNLSIVACYLAASLVMRLGTPMWRRCALIALGCMALGSCFSSGRSGWLAAAAAMIYLVWRRGFTRKVLATFALGLLVLVPTYFLSKTFRDQVQKTLSPQSRYLRTYGVGVMGLDDAGRLKNWSAAAKRFPQAPLWGAGFFHRGGYSALRFTGSHNFFLQMFLETGMVGGLLVLLIFFVMWRQASTPVSRAEQYEIPLKCALLAAFVGGFGGEYFYGGPPVLALIAVYGPVGALACRGWLPAPSTLNPWAGAQVQHA